MYGCVGAYFSGRTGFPSLSITATAGVNFNRLPNPWNDEDLRDKQGNPRSLHASRELTGKIALQPRKGLSGAEATRADIGWVSPDGSNLDAVALDLSDAILSQAIPWLDSWDTESAALSSWLAEDRDYPGRTWSIYALAKVLSRTDITDSFRERLQRQWPSHYKKLV